ncbi:MAG: type IX secretion system sortase PorU [Muribaculaceae bacterium]|nr:type IX secretion system sortase PorU [Muribaculaceae bacterium]
MRKLTKFKVACVAMMAVLCASYASAFNPSIYATQSKLATGKWVKVVIPESGVYEITYDELREMGFSSPDKVHVYGVGGNRISEQLNGANVDDLKQVPILRTGDKICFYGNGPVAFTLSDYSTNPHYTRVFNPYSQVGCYFLTEESSSELVPEKKAVVSVTSYINNPVSLGYFYHERELMSVSNSGKEMLGEDLSKQRVLIDYYLPHLADSTIVVHSAIAANASEMTYANAVLHSGGATDTTVYTTASSRIYMPSENSYTLYNFATPYGSLKLTHPAENGQYEPMIKYTSSSGYSIIGRLDYFILTYKHENILADADDNQLLMGYGVTRGTDRFMLPNAPSSTVVWYINNTKSPMEVTTNPYNDASGRGLAFFSNPSSRSMYVAFDPTKTLKKILRYETVENQNLHAMPVPELLVITADDYVEQANRLADLHRAVDGIDVAVVTQNQVFNEFSSGTRDAMAYRLLCKMLYDRDNTKFKNLLLFGTGSFDNRELMGEHPNDLLTYQSDNSNVSDQSFTSDDFYGFMDDSSGTNITNDKLRIGVGRITCADVDEARSDVDKIVEYYANPDYGVWRNNALVMSDSPDQGEYMFQGQGYKNQIDNELNTGMHVNSVHNTMYPRSTTQPAFGIDRKTATEAMHMISYYLTDGTYFATYVGHAGAVSFTKVNKMWTTGDVARTRYPHYPIFSTACCDVAHYDNDTRGIAELMFHKRDGGAIAMLTSSRMVYASPNDKLNQNFINALFSYDSKRVMPTLGEAYKESKLGFTTADVNKMSFFLLGDPAIKVNYPISRFNITSVNGTDMTGTAKAQLSPLCKFEISAQVVDAEGNIDTGFNGDATVSLYDMEDYFTSLTFKVDGEPVERGIYRDRPKLAEVTGRVVNGMFTGTMIVPQSPMANGDDVQIRVYAHKDNSDYMVNGFTKQVTMLPYNETAAINDNEAPVITSMFLNDETAFADGAVVAPNAMLYITASDNEGISMQANSAACTMKLMLDGGKQSYEDVTCYAAVSDGGKTVDVEFPLSNLSEGQHTLTYMVYDMLGNEASRTITFMVGQNGVVDLVADKMPAFLDGTVSFDVETELTRVPDMVVRVTDATGKLMWMTTANSFPVTWDMKDMNGNKVPAGLYRYFGTYNDGVNYGGTSINKLIVLDPLTTASGN